MYIRFAFNTTPVIPALIQAHLLEPQTSYRVATHHTLLCSSPLQPQILRHSNNTVIRTEQRSTVPQVYRHPLRVANNRLATP